MGKILIYKLMKIIKKTPSIYPNLFFNTIIGESIIVKMNNNIEYVGILKCLDNYMNLIIGQTQEGLKGVVINKWGDVFIRGNNILYISSTSVIKNYNESEKL